MCVPGADTENTEDENPLPEVLTDPSRDRGEGKLAAI